MIRLISLSALSACLLAISVPADAQGQRPSGAQNRGAPSQSIGSRPTISGQSETRRVTAEALRREAGANRVESETRRAAAQARREAAQANNRSEDARAAHPPNEKAAEEAFLAEQNADKKNLRAERRALRRANRGAE
jgi:hypothetical protein